MKGFLALERHWEGRTVSVVPKRSKGSVDEEEEEEGVVAQSSNSSGGEDEKGVEGRSNSEDVVFASPPHTSEGVDVSRRAVETCHSARLAFCREDLAGFLLIIRRTSPGWVDVFASREGDSDLVSLASMEGDAVVSLETLSGSVSLPS